MFRLKIVLSLLIAAIPLAAWASPQTTICLTESLVTNRVAGSEQALNDAKARVEQLLWKSTASPQILFLDDKPVFGLLNYNNYGSSISLPHKTCLLIGSKGANVDVIAHELVHAEIAHQIGYWEYFWLPRWLDEGIAMQVDFRERYNAFALDRRDPRYVMAKTGSEFYKGPMTTVVQNCAAAKALVKAWLDKKGVPRLYEQLLNQRTELIDSFSR